MLPDAPALTPRDLIAECLRAARTAPRPGTTRYERVLERCLSEHMRLGNGVPIEVVVIEQLSRGASHRRTRPPGEPGGLVGA